ncbi:MAG: SDR family oxidoreductase [Acidobacteriota bacterium]|nr:MAG: SDR family oxidoreductase [Acidobacteriota bacterium]
MTELRDARVVITGAASGLGRRMALGVAERGGTLSLWDVNEAGLDAVVAEIEGLGGRAQPVVCDVSDRRAVYAAAGGIAAPVDVLINNAGVVSGKSLLEIPDEQIERSLQINTQSLFWMTKAFLPAMIERNRGHIVTIASAAGLIGVPRLTDYCASKFAAVGFDESLRVELRQRAPGVRTTVVCPYYIDTGMFEGVKTRFSFLLPILKEAKVADRILKAVERDRPRLQMPALVHTIPLLRLLPVQWFDTVARVLGISASTDDFVGRNHDPP